MKVLLINQFFYPDEAATAQLMTDLAVDLKNAGMDVSVLAGRASYFAQKGEKSTAPLDPSIAVYRVPCASLERGHIVKRLWSYVTFFLFASIRALFLKRPDAVVVLSTPPFLPLLGWILKTLKRTKLVCWVQDLYPEVAIELGVIRRSSIVTRWIDAFLTFTLRQADRAVCLSEGMKKVLVLKGLEAERVTVIPNWADGREIFPASKLSNPFLQEWGLENSFIVLYSGNMGLPHEFSTVLGVAKELGHFPDIVFLFIGEGPRSREIEEARRTCSNIRCLPHQARERLLFSLGVADVGLVSLKKGLENVVVPSKIYALMAAAKPVLCIAPLRGVLADIIQQAQCGFVVAPGDQTGLKECLLHLYYDTRLRQQLGRNGRRYFETHFDRPQSTQKHHDLLTELCLR